MQPSILPRTLLLAFVFAVGISAGAQAGTIYTFGTGDDSLKGATGYLDFQAIDADTTKVVWGMDTSGFHDLAATKTDHTLLTHVAFKVSGITSAELMDASLGLYSDVFPSSLSNGGCGLGSPSSFVCLTLANPIDATDDQLIEIAFLVEGSLDLDSSISYRGKFGPGTGWVISESTGPAVPEPSAALVFGLGLLVLRSRLRSPRRA